MDPFVRRFIRSSLVWLGVGVLIGVAMAVSPRAVAFRTAHMHANLLGFVSMMIFGVAYHVIPRFTGRPLHSRRAANVHLWIANAGLAGMVTGFVLRVYRWELGMPILAVGAVLSATGALLFIHNIWRTLDAPAPAPRPAGLPTLAR
jgi:cbb3-type cytochrome oxidase subunit 1